MVNCLSCNKPLRSIGLNRKNGRLFVSGENNNEDWKNRKYHKKCWKEKQNSIMYDFIRKENELKRLEEENELLRNTFARLEIKKENKKDEDKFENDKITITF